MKLYKTLLSLLLLVNVSLSAVSVKEFSVTNENSTDLLCSQKKCFIKRPFILSQDEMAIKEFVDYAVGLSLVKEKEDGAVVQLYLWDENDSLVANPILICAWGKRTFVEFGEHAENQSFKLTFEIVLAE